jgi:hypothetical protein
VLSLKKVSPLVAPTEENNLSSTSLRDHDVMDMFSRLRLATVNQGFNCAGTV